MGQRIAQSHTRTVQRRKPRLSKVTNARDALADFGRGKETYCLTFGQFSLLDAIEAILEKTGPADVALSTWTAGSADLSRSEEHMRDGRIRSLRFVCDCSFGQRQPGYLATLRDLFGDDAIRTTRTHAKFAVITNDAWDVDSRRGFSFRFIDVLTATSQESLVITANFACVRVVRIASSPKRSRSVARYPGCR